MKKKSKPIVSDLRKRAEKKLLSREKVFRGDDFNSKDPMRLVHELEVHQIELELQNEELILAREKAEIAAEKYSELFELTPVGYITLSKIGDIIDLNRISSTLLQKNRTQLIGRRFTLFVSEETRQNFLFFLDRLFQTKSKESCEVILTAKDLLPIQVNMLGIASEKDEQCFVTIVDITARKKAEALMIRYQIITKYARDPMLLIDLEGKIVESNQAAVDLYGYNHEELSRLKLTDLRVQDEPLIVKHQLQEALAHGILFEALHKCKDGTFVPVEVNSRGVFVEGKQMFLSIIRNITTRKKIEYELQEAKEKLELALDNGNIGIWEWDLKTDVVTLDERAARIFVIKPVVFGGTFQAFEDLINEEDISHFHKAINDTLAKDLPFETIFRTRSNNGKSRYISSKALLYKGEYGKALSLTGVCFDITSLKEGTEQLVLKLNEDLLRSNNELERFAYVASHDLQEPLRMVTSFTQLLEQQYKDKLDQKAKDYIHFAVDGSKRMYELLNGLLAYSRINTRGKEFNRVDLNHVVDIVLKNLLLQIRERNASVKIDELPIVFADESQMIQLFQNLITNSIKFSPETPKIYISASSDVTEHIISVKDEGIGIESQYFERIFKIFQRLFPQGQYEGTGVGLSISKRIVERHKGRIWVESAFGKGSAFIFTIPKKH